MVFLPKSPQLLTGLRTKSDRAAYGIRSDGVRNLIGWRTESDRFAYGI